MTHLLPADELRRQFEAGEITREYYEAMRGTQAAPAERLCGVCGRRPAHVIERGQAMCGVCGLRARTARKRGW